MLKLFGGFTCFELYIVGLNVQGNTINFFQYFCDKLNLQSIVRRRK